MLGADPPAADGIAWLERAAAQDHAAAAAKLGALHAEGRFVPQDAEAALRWFRYAPGGVRFRRYMVDDLSFDVRYDGARSLVMLDYPGSSAREQSAWVEGVHPEPSTPPRLLDGSRAIPRVPRTKRGRLIPGNVKLVVRVEADGSVGGIQVHRVEPLGQGHAEAAIEAVRQWRFAPATADGEPVRVIHPVCVGFANH